MSSDLSGIFADPIILNILTRLPAKSLCRFRSVSTRWNSVITQPQFVTSYLSRHSPTWFTLDRVVRVSATRSEPDPIRFNLNSNSGVFILTVNPHLLLKPGEPVSSPNRYPIPAEVLHSSNGLVLFAVNIDPDPSKVQTRDVLFVANPTTKEWARLPSPSWDLDWRFGVILMTRPGPVGEFVVGAFVHDPVSGGCTLTCYGSETGKWVKKDVGNQVGSRVWFATYRFEFRGKMCCSDTNFGIIIWEEDPFVGCLSEEKAVCGFIPLPSRRARHTVDSERKRCVDGAGEWIQYMEMFTEGEIALEVWRLQDWKEGEWDWELVYKVPKLVLDTFVGGDNWVGNVVFVNPFDPDVVIIHGMVFIYSLDVRTGVVKSCRSFTGHMCGMPCVVPSWPPSLPPRLYADYIKEQGNIFFKDTKFMEAVKCYSRSIGLSSSVAAYANRAMAYIKLSRFCEAEEDCTAVLNVDNKAFKVYWRRSIAREGLGNLEGALEDVESAMKLQPDDKRMKKRYDELKCLVDKVSVAEGQSDHGEQRAG